MVTDLRGSESTGDQLTKRALITGSAGLIGRYMKRQLSLDGWDISCCDLRRVPGYDNVALDARDLFRVNDIRYDLIVHCAAHVGGREDIEGKKTFIAARNYQLDAAMFEWALRTRPAHIIYWSSSAAYPIKLQEGHGALPDRRLAEDDIDLERPRLPDESYGAVKLAGEQMAAWAREDGLKVHVLRPFSGWAANQDTTYPMSAYLLRAMKRFDPFDVWGDGEQVRDFIHASDVVKAALAAVYGDHLGPLNLCSGIGTSFNELADLVCKAAGYTPTIRHHPDKPVGVRYRVGDPTEMLKVYRPDISLEYGIRSVLSE